MEITVKNVDLKYAWSVWHSIEFTIPGRKEKFLVTIVENYDTNSDSSTFELTCAEGGLTDDELLEIESTLIEIVEKEKE